MPSFKNKQECSLHYSSPFDRWNDSHPPVPGQSEIPRSQAACCSSPAPEPTVRRRNETACIREPLGIRNLRRPVEGYHRKVSTVPIVSVRNVTRLLYCRSLFYRRSLPWAVRHPPFGRWRNLRSCEDRGSL